MIHPLVSDLLVLQERDLRVAKFVAERDRIPLDLAVVEKEIALRLAKFEDLKIKTRLIESDRKKIDLEVKAKETAIARYKTQQQQTRKNEEFTALDHQMTHEHHEISLLEDKELALMEAYDQGQVAVAEGQKALEEFQIRAKQKKEDLALRLTTVEKELATAKERQGQAEATLEASVVSQYRRVLKSKGDVAVVPVQHHTCGGCHMKVTSQTWISAQKAEGLVSCENCGRFVFFGD